jgi:hypothetical protein
MGLVSFLWPQEAEPEPSRSDLPEETYRCIGCGGELTVRSVASLQPCPGCDGRTWEFTGADLELWR